VRTEVAWFDVVEDLKRAGATQVLPPPQIITNFACPPITAAQSQAQRIVRRTFRSLSHHVARANGRNPYRQDLTVMTPSL
jgi:hypothetical protein